MVLCYSVRLLTLSNLNFLRLDDQVRKARISIVALDLRLALVYTSIVVLQICFTPFFRKHAMC